MLFCCRLSFLVYTPEKMSGENKTFTFLSLITDTTYRMEL